MLNEKLKTLKIIYQFCFTLLECVWSFNLKIPAHFLLLLLACFPAATCLKWQVYGILQTCVYWLQYTCLGGTALLYKVWQVSTMFVHTYLLFAAIDGGGNFNFNSKFHKQTQQQQKRVAEKAFTNNELYSIKVVCCWVGQECYDDGNVAAASMLFSWVEYSRSRCNSSQSKAVCCTIIKMKTCSVWVCWYAATA